MIFGCEVRNWRDFSTPPTKKVLVSASVSTPVGNAYVAVDPPR